MKNLLNKRSIPDFFVNENGKITTLDVWEKHREHLKELFLKEEYGYLPERLVPKVKTERQWVDFAGKAIWDSVFFELERNGEAYTVRAELILPKAHMLKGTRKAPVFLSLNFQSEVPNKYLPVEEIIDNGFGIFALCYERVTKDNGDFEDGLCRLFERNGENAFGKISLWAYMSSICMDYLLTREEVDKDNVAIIGHSRLGKTALLCSALDKRFKLTCANNSGCCGASISRGKTKENETLEDITRVFPYWFCDSFKKYVSNEQSLPFDQHMLLALIAPRYVLIGCAKEDVWADNDGQRLSCELSSYAWSLYGKGYEARVSAYERDGSHFLSRADWNTYMTYFKEILENEI